MPDPLISELAFHQFFRAQLLERFPDDDDSQNRRRNAR